MFPDAERILELLDESKPLIGLGCLVATGVGLLLLVVYLLWKNR